MKEPDLGCQESWTTRDGSILWGWGGKLMGLLLSLSSFLLLKQIGRKKTNHLIWNKDNTVIKGTKAVRIQIFQVMQTTIAGMLKIYKEMQAEHKFFISYVLVSAMAIKTAILKLKTSPLCREIEP